MVNRSSFPLMRGRQRDPAAGLRQVRHRLHPPHPRTCVLSPDGQILFQSAGNRPQEFEQMVKVVEEAVIAASQHNARK